MYEIVYVFALRLHPHIPRRVLPTDSMNRKDNPAAQRNKDKPTARHLEASFLQLDSALMDHIFCLDETG